MNNCKQIKVKDITVFGKQNEVLSLCTYIRARNLVLRGSAVWIDRKNISLLVNSDDRKILRKQIMKEAKNTCYICNEQIPEGVSPTLDHLIPKAKRGRDVKENLKCCCRRCNDSKANILFEDYIQNIINNPIDYPWITEDRLRYLVDNYITK